MPERFDKFTGDARRALQYAQEEAQRLKHSYLGTEHLLLGLLRQRRGAHATALADAGVDVDRARSTVESIVGGGGTLATGEVGLTPGAKRVIELAVDEARRLNHTYIGTEHLLLGLLREGEGVAAASLRSLGVSPDSIRAHIIRDIALDPSLATGHRIERAARTVLRPLERLRRARPRGEERTTDPWTAFGPDVSVVQVDALLLEMDRLNDEISYRRVASGAGYECGVVRFLPRSEQDRLQITHADKDVVCHVLRGRGRLSLDSETRDLEPGAVCRIPARTPHDFAAVDEPLVLFYVSVAVE